jgi:hypothetical protein
MALSDLAVFNEYAHSAFTEVQKQQIELFNAATERCIALRGGNNQGDYSEAAFFAKVSGGLVRRRNAYGSGAISSAVMSHLRDVSVKVASGTPEVRLDPGQFKWIQQNPEEAGAAMGQQLAQDSLADMLNVGLGAAYAAMAQVSAIVTNISVQTATTVAAANEPSWGALNTAAFNFGDRSSDIRGWVMHSTPMRKLFAANLANGEGLFSYGTVNVVRDPFGKFLVMTDSPNLFVLDTVPAPDANQYRILGLTPGAIEIEQNDDYTENIQTENGDENIIRSFQAEWSYNLGLKGFRWDRTNGGPSPTNAAIFTGTNWDRYATSDKDLPGVVLLTN